MSLSPNFLHLFQKKEGSLMAGIALAVFGAASIFGSQWYPWLLPLYALIGVFFFFVSHIKTGVLFVFVLGLFHSLEIDFSRYTWTKTMPLLAAINAPLVDFVVLLLAIACAVAMLLRLFPREATINWRAILPGMVLYGLFLCIALISASSAYDHQIAGSLKYLIRPMGFAFLFFVILPLIIMDSLRDVHSVLKLWFWSGIGIALYGASSLVIGGGSDWLRVVPYSIGSLAPFGYNHNLLAEVLVMLIPTGIYVGSNAPREARRWYMLGTIFMATIAALTLSRAAWIVLFIQAGMMWGFSKRAHMPRVRLSSVFLVAAAVILPLLLYFSFFLRSSVVKSSTFARVVTTDIVLSYVAHQPLFGYGPGMYIPVLTDTAIYGMEFGEALDAHGFIQKILLEEGAVGLMFFVFFLVWLVWRLYQNTHEDEPNRILSGYVLIICISAIVFQVFNTSYFNSVMWLPVGMAMVTLSLVAKKERV